MVDRVICSVLPLARTLNPSSPISLRHERGVVTSAKILFRSLCTPLYTLSRSHYVYRPSSKMACSVPCIKFLNADVTTPRSTIIFSSSVFPHPLARLALHFIAQQDGRRSRFVVHSVKHAPKDLRLPHPATFPTPPASGSTASRPLFSHCPNTNIADTRGKIAINLPVPIPSFCSN